MFRGVFGFLAIAWLLSPTPAAAEWLPVSTSMSGSVYYMDGERISSDNGRIRAWVKIDHSKNRSVRYRSEMQLWSFICASQKTNLLSYTEYDSYGKAVGSGEARDSNYSDAGYSVVTPETVAETIMKIACAASS